MTTFNVKGCVFLMRGFALSGVTHFLVQQILKKTKRKEDLHNEEKDFKHYAYTKHARNVHAAPVSALSANWADWAKPMLNAAIDAGIVTADDTDLLATGTPITRAEMAKIISRTLDYLGKAKAADPDTSKITDWNYIAEVYKPYIADAYSKGIITGYNDGSFGPANHLTRAEASAVIVRMIDAQ